MKILKKIIIIVKLVLLFGLIGCGVLELWGGPPHRDMSAWSVVIVNQLPYPIYVEVIFNPRAYTNSQGARQELSIESGEIAFANKLSMEPNLPSQAHRGIREILVFSEDKIIPLMILRGTAMNEYVIHVGDYRPRGWQFCLEVNEENIGVGLNKGIDFEEDVEDEIGEYEDNQDDIEENIDINLSENV